MMAVPVSGCSMISTTGVITIAAATPKSLMFPSETFGRLRYDASARTVVILANSAGCRRNAPKLNQLVDPDTVRPITSTAISMAIVRPYAGREMA